MDNEGISIHGVYQHLRGSNLSTRNYSRLNELHGVRLPFPPLVVSIRKPPLSVFRIIVFFGDSWVPFEGAIEIIDRTPPTRLHRRVQPPGGERGGWMQIDSCV